ncbi:MAG: DNA-binding protein HU-beta [uncultured Thiotrichaceae bacterium]|uniref:DNA-binding protein HU-beta n=1 Tax=uncultured Thiotrichaceae bacterium TaxID=298394 RepID=A0A6S6UIC9_9GAMM|nr:MAG: DNA-binding protein HU-beta [uncultured Thiotrichaceae bacterium]
MNKSQLIDAVAGKSGLTKADTEKAFKAFVETISEEMGKGEQITLIGFGTFLVRDRKARTGRNPRTGEEIKIAASKIPAFKAGKALKDAVN